MDRALIKSRAKEFAFNNKWNIWKISIINALISFAISFVFGLIAGLSNNSSIAGVLSLVVSIGVMPLTVGANYYLIKLIKGEKIDAISALFSKFNLIGLIIIVTVGIMIVTTLWSMLFLIPGIIYAFKVVMAQYLLADVATENSSYGDIVGTSKRMMDGYKLDLFVFNLSFIGWLLLGVITFGIAYIWVVPYIQTANIMYYEELKKVKNIG